MLGDRIQIQDSNETNNYFITKQEFEYTGALDATLNEGEHKYGLDTPKTDWETAIYPPQAILTALRAIYPN
jgi:hypothetical protein